MKSEEIIIESDDALFLVFARNAFYKRKFYLVLGVFLLSWAVIAILICMLVYLVNHPTRPFYFIADDVGRLIPDVPVQQPIMSNDDVAKWTVNAVEAAYTYNYMDFRQQLQSAQKYFTDYGWRNYMAGLASSNNLLALNQRKMIVTANVVDTPKLLTEGPLGESGALAWKFQMPVLVTYMYPPYDDNSKFSNPLQVTVIVQRQSIIDSYQGLGVLQMNATLVVNAPQ